MSGSKRLRPQSAQIGVFGSILKKKGQSKMEQTQDNHLTEQQDLNFVKIQNGNTSGLSEIINENGTVKVSALNSKRIVILEEEQQNSIE